MCSYIRFVNVCCCLLALLSRNGRKCFVVVELSLVLVITYRKGYLTCIRMEGIYLYVHGWADFHSLDHILHVLLKCLGSISCLTLYWSHVCHYLGRVCAYSSFS